MITESPYALQGIKLIPEGGWGWAICAAAFLSQFIVLGIHNSFGILFAFLLEEFGKSKAATGKEIDCICEACFPCFFVCPIICFPRHLFASIVGLSVRFICPVYLSGLSVRFIWSVRSVGSVFTVWPVWYVCSVWSVFCLVCLFCLFFLVCLPDWSVWSVCSV